MLNLKVIRFFVAAIFLINGVFVSAAGESVPERESWQNTVSVDVMDGMHTFTAASIRVSPLVAMGSPYQDMEAWLAVSCRNKIEWAYVGFAPHNPNISNMRVLRSSGRYWYTWTRVKWDDVIELTPIINELWTSELHFDEDNKAILRISTSKVVTLELDWHGEGLVHFVFPLKGADDALKTMRSGCMSQ
jgi:hypothetical protein